MSSLNSQNPFFLEPADCGDPGVPMYGSKTGHNYLAGGMVTFTCDAGYHLEGSTKMECLENGNWDNDPPKCKKREIAFCIKR